MERLTEDSVTGETYIKQCASSCPYDGEYCGTDECPVLNKAADKLGEYERAEEQEKELKKYREIGTIEECQVAMEKFFEEAQLHEALRVLDERM